MFIESQYCQIRKPPHFTMKFIVYKITRKPPRNILLIRGINKLKEIGNVDIRLMYV